MKFFDRLDVQFGLVHDCIRACVYADYIMRHENKKDAWWAICDMCYADAIISWNQIFGAWSQKAHWKEFMKDCPVPKQSKLRPFSKELVTEYLKVPLDQWEAYHKSLKAVRDSRLAHFDHDAAHQELPNITWVLHSSYFYRIWLLEFLRELQKLGYKLRITDESNEDMLKRFREQIAAACV